jgi:hypothetical protein
VENPGSVLRPQERQFLAVKTGAHTGHCIVPGHIIGAKRTDQPRPPQRKTGAARFAGNEAPGPRRRQPQQLRQRGIIEMMQKQIGSNDVGPQLRQALEDIARQAFAAPSQGGEPRPGFRTDDALPVQDDDFHIRPASRQPPRHFQQEAAIAAAQISQQSGRRKACQHLRHDGALAHHCVDARQIAAGAERPGIVGLEKIQ